MPAVTVYTLAAEIEELNKKINASLALFELLKRQIRTHILDHVQDEPENTDG